MVQVYKTTKEGLKAVLLFLLLLMGSSCTSGSKEMAFTVNGEVIDTAEYIQQLDKEKLMVIRDFQNKYQTGYSADFWTTDFEGRRPLDVLKERAKTVIVLRSIKKALAKEMGIIQKTSYKDFLKELDSMNQNRQAAVKAGEVIYGPVTYSEEMYRGYSLSLLENAVKAKMSTPGSTQEQVKAKYNALVREKINQAKVSINKKVYEKIKIH